MKVSKFLRNYLKSAMFKGKPRFEILDAGDEHCLPVVGARLNPELKLKYNDIDLQHGVAEYHWYVVIRTYGSVYFRWASEIAKSFRNPQHSGMFRGTRSTSRTSQPANLTSYAATRTRWTPCSASW
jgi:hypothetical protein